MLEESCPLAETSGFGTAAFLESREVAVPPASPQLRGQRELDREQETSDGLLGHLWHGRRIQMYCQSVIPSLYLCV